MWALNANEVFRAPPASSADVPVWQNMNHFARTDSLEGNKQSVISILRRSIGAESRTLDSLLKGADPETYRHGHRVSGMSLLLAGRLEMRPSVRQTIGEAAELHDVGKLCVPDYILNRTTAFHWSHWEMIQKIPELSESLARAANYDDRTRLLILRVHERADGRGYPYGLTGKHVPFAAQIIQVADMFDSLNRTVSFRPAYPISVALEIIGAYAENGAFDRIIAQALDDYVMQAG